MRGSVAVYQPRGALTAPYLTTYPQTLRLRAKPYLTTYPQSQNSEAVSSSARNLAIVSEKIIADFVKLNQNIHK